MIDIENDAMLKRLAEFVGVDLSNLEIIDEYEQKEIELAHEIRGVSYDDIAHFFSRVRIPEFISPEWIFKALKFNDSFYTQNLALIRATEWMRQEVYNTNCKEIKKRERIYPILNGQRKKNANVRPIIESITSERLPDGTIWKTTKTNVKHNNTSILAGAAAASEDSGILCICSENVSKQDFTICQSEWFSYPGNKELKKALIRIHPHNMKQFLEEKRTLYIVFFTNENKVYLAEADESNITHNETIIELSVLIKDIESITEFDISYTEDIDFYF
ncbi:hypothetical protein [uncultured Treponema sp.]|uniref:hypothetical protein n=1 Tax=uncultured Treponema sp. TaxID=162155 RepID=UPI0025F52C80|nr:hypothetical protein [uncultured Treponema sp.]